VDCQNFGVWPHELIELVYVTNHHVVFGVLAQQQSLDYTQAVWHIFSSCVGPRLVFEDSFVEESVAVFLRNRRR